MLKKPDVEERDVEEGNRMNVMSRMQGDVQEGVDVRRDVEEERAGRRGH